MANRLITSIVLAFILAQSAGAKKTTTITRHKSSCPCTTDSLFPQPRPSTVIYTTTNAEGSKYVTTRTTNRPTEPKPTVSSYTVTKADGAATVVLTTLRPRSRKPPGYITVPPPHYDTKLPPPHTISKSPSPSRYVSRSSIPSSSTSLPPAEASSPCPGPLASTYTSKAGVAWQLFCLANFFYYDLPATRTESMDECMDACDSYMNHEDYSQKCVAITWTGLGNVKEKDNNCRLKFSIKQVVYGQDRYCSAKRVSYGPPAGLAVSVVPSYAAAVSLPIPTKSLDFTAINPTLVPRPFQPQKCPLPDRYIYTPPDGANVKYRVLCGVSFYFSDLPSVNVETMKSCMAACNAWVPNPAGQLYDTPCIAVTFIGYNSNEPSCKRHFSTSGGFQTNLPYGHSALRMDQPTSWLDDNTPNRQIKAAEALSSANVLSTISTGLKNALSSTVTSVGVISATGVPQPGDKPHGQLKRDSGKLDF